MSAPTSVQDTALGLTQSELLILRHQQQLIAQQPGQRGVMVDRGRGTSRHSQPSSRAASAASSQSVPGRIVLDPRSLSSLSASLDNLLANIRSRIQQLDDAVSRSVHSSGDQSMNALQRADEEIDRMKRVLAEINRLEEDCARVRNIRDVVKQLRARVDSASNRLDRTISTGHHHHHHHHHQPPTRMTVPHRHDPRRRIGAMMHNAAAVDP